MALRKACTVSNTIRNTGKECDVAMSATAMLIAVPPSASFVEADLDDPVEWLKDNIHALKAVRWYPLFGQQAPIRTITNNKEADAVVTMDDGSQVFLRYGFYNRVFETTSGGLCYAQALQSLTQSGYRMLEIDQQGKLLLRDNKDAGATLSGMISDFINGQSPILADFKNTPYKNVFGYSLAPNELVNNGKIFDGAEDLLSMMGLIDAEIFEAAAATTTKLKIGVRTECAETDLIALLSTALADVTNFIVTNKATGAVVVPSGAAIAGGLIELTGTYVSGQTYNVIGSDASVWYANLIEGYEASIGVDILIP